MTRQIAVAVFVLWLAALLPGAARAVPPESDLVESPTHLPGARVISLATGAGGGLWFAAETQTVGAIDPGGSVRQFTGAPFAAGRLVSGPQGILWVGSRGIVGLTPNGERFEYPRRRKHARQGLLAVAPDGTIYYTLAFKDARRRAHLAIVVLPASGKARRIQLAPTTEPQGMVVGPEGDLWVSELGPQFPAIARIIPSGHVTRFRLPTRSSRPGTIVVGPDGNLWFAEARRAPRTSSAWIGRITPQGRIDEFAVPGMTSIGQLASGPDGDLWFTAAQGEGPYEVDSMTPGGRAAQPTCVISSCELEASAIAEGPEGALWVAASFPIRGPGGGGSGINRLLFARSEGSNVGRFAPPAQTIAKEAP